LGNGKGGGWGTGESHRRIDGELYDRKIDGSSRDEITETGDRDEVIEEAKTELQQKRDQEMHSIRTGPLGFVAVLKDGVTTSSPSQR